MKRREKIIKIGIMILRTLKTFLFLKKNTTTFSIANKYLKTIEGL